MAEAGDALFDEGLVAIAVDFLKLLTGFIEQDVERAQLVVDHFGGNVLQDAFEGGAGFVVVFAITLDPDFTGGFPAFELADIGAGTAFADAKELLHAVKRSRGGTEVQKGVDLADDAAVAEGLGRGAHSGVLRTQVDQGPLPQMHCRHV